MPGLMPEAAEAFYAAAREARELGHHYVAPEHLVLGVIQQPEELGGRALAELGVTATALRVRIGDRLGTGPPRPDGSLSAARRRRCSLNVGLTPSGSETSLPRC
jgi:ATP-dependent Clp protease ATP-binding subunit ClpC